MANKFYLNIDTILIDKGDHKVRFNRGDELVDVPAGSLDSMIRLRQAVAEMPVVEEEHAAPTMQVVETAVPVESWEQTRIADMDLPKGIKKNFADAGISTIAEALEIGAKHGRLSIDGMTEAKEKAFQAAVEALRKLEEKPKEGDA